MLIGSGLTSRCRQTGLQASLARLLNGKPVSLTWLCTLFFRGNNIIPGNNCVSVSAALRPLRVLTKLSFLRFFLCFGVFGRGVAGEVVPVLRGGFVRLETVDQVMSQANQPLQTDHAARGC